MEKDAKMQKKVISTIEQAVKQIFVSQNITLSDHDSLMVNALACHAADPDSNPAQGNDINK